MSFYHWKKKLTKDPCKLLCLVRQSWQDDKLQYLVSVRIYRYADVCTPAPERGSWQSAEQDGTVREQQGGLWDKTRCFTPGNSSCLDHRLPRVTPAKAPRTFILSFLICPIGRLCLQDHTPLGKKYYFLLMS